MPQSKPEPKINIPTHMHTSINKYTRSSHARISSPDWLVTLRIWNKVLPTITNKKIPSRIGPILFYYTFFYINLTLLPVSRICRCSSCDASRFLAAFIGRLAFIDTGLLRICLYIITLSNTCFLKLYFILLINAFFYLCCRLVLYSFNTIILKIT